MFKTRKPSPATRAKHERLLGEARARYHAASIAVNTWAIENGYGHVRWSELEPIAYSAIPDLMAAKVAATDAQTKAEDAAVAAWTHYRGTYGLLFPVSH